MRNVLLIDGFQKSRAAVYNGCMVLFDETLMMIHSTYSFSRNNCNGWSGLFVYFSTEQNSKRLNLLDHRKLNRGLLRHTCTYVPYG